MEISIGFKLKGKLGYLEVYLLFDLCGMEGKSHKLLEQGNT